MRTIARHPLRGPALILLAATLLAGCQSASERPAPAHAARADGWRVVERLGDIRYLPPGATSWGPAMSGTVLPIGSQVITGHGGRLILARDDVQVSAGTSSRFTLPDGENELAHSAGTLRYRIGRADGVRLRVATPTLHLEADRAVFDVDVSATATEVQVEDGRIVVATPANDQRTVLNAGHAARSGDADRRALAVRTAPGGTFERVGPEILKAIAPKPVKRPSEPAPGPTSLERGPAAPQPDHTAMATVTRGLKGSAVRPAGYRTPPVDAADDAPAPAQDEAATAASSGDGGREHPVDERQRRFDRLTHGLLHGLPPARP